MAGHGERRFILHRSLRRREGSILIWGCLATSGCGQFTMGEGEQTPHRILDEVQCKGGRPPGEDQWEFQAQNYLLTIYPSFEVTQPEPEP